MRPPPLNHVIKFIPRVPLEIAGSGAGQPHPAFGFASIGNCRRLVGRIDIAVQIKISTDIVCGRIYPGLDLCRIRTVQVVHIAIVVGIARGRSERYAVRRISNTLDLLAGIGEQCNNIVTPVVYVVHAFVHDAVVVRVLIAQDRVVDV
jgi:hypothetical protein